MQELCDPASNALRPCSFPLSWYLILRCTDYEKKIQSCKQKAAAAESESAADAELDSLQIELEEKQNLERQLREELRYVFLFIIHFLDLSPVALANNFYLINTVIVNELDDLERNRENVEEQRQTIKKFEQDEARSQ